MKDSSMKKSHLLLTKAKKIIPGGGQNARRLACFTNSYPVFIEKSKGAHIWDVDDNEYVDWLCSYGPIILGHCYDKVDDAVISMINSGILFNLHSPVQITLSEKLIEHIPSAEMCISLNTGSEATEAAIRIARAYTGKDVIIRWGFHGWFDWSVENKLGVPNGVSNYVKSFQYNDLASLEEVLEKNKGKVAGIIMMPFEVIPPKKGFLEGVRKLADIYKTVLIFDEIRSWPRMGLGGAQSYFNVIPDITTISKGIANGYPLSAVVGKAEFMQVAEKTAISATYAPGKLGMVAALETIKQLEDGSVMGHIWEIATKLGDGLRSLIESRNIKATVFGMPQLPFLMFGDKELNTLTLNNQSMVATVNLGLSKGGNKEIEKANLLTELFYSETIKRGIFFHPKHHWFTCYAHTDEDINKTLNASEESLDIAIRSL
ncbi:MAG: aminotransferase class III-fold pyridoxal phosphate-dependent enzyme [Actinobacteria bacterium]|nr:aminotransferase class III-fold pyridoxal phosphate-dependent enzyme [Actinomycetota bacterium]